MKEISETELMSIRDVLNQVRECPYDLQSGELDECIELIDALLEAEDE